MQTTNKSYNGTHSVSDTSVKYVRLYDNSTATNFIDISMMVNYIEVYESIYSPFLTVNISVTDTNGVSSAFRMKGEEFVEIDVRGPDNRLGIVGQVFNVYEVADRVVTSNGSITYTLKCISPAAIVDMNIKISQSFSGQPSELVGNTFAKTLSIVGKPVLAEESKHIVSYVSNYWSPMKNIKYLCDRTVSKRSGAANYVFFERKNEFRFESIDNMVVRPPTNNFTYSLNTNDARMRNNPQEQMFIIHNLYVDRSFNYIDRIMTGAYGNRTLNVDSHTKSYSYQYYDFLESFSKFSRLNELPLGTSNSVRRINSVFRTINSPTLVYTTMPDEHSIDWYKQRLTELAAINATTIDFDAVGRFYIGAGDVITVTIPKITAAKHISNRENELSKLIDPTLSGRYLVTSIRHLIDRERHTINVQASKDSYIKE